MQDQDECDARDTYSAVAIAFSMLLMLPITSVFVDIWGGMTGTKTPYFVMIPFIILSFHVTYVCFGVIMGVTTWKRGLAMRY